MLDHTIQEIVLENLIFQAKSSQGWNMLYCEVCGDGSRTKGPRGGWLFVDESCIYHCFNCNITESFDPDRDYPYSKGMRKVFTSFGIDVSETDKLTQKNFFNGEKSTKPIKKKFDIPQIDIPDYFIKLEDAKDTNVLLHKAVKFLNKRQIDFLSYPFYLSTGFSNQGSADNAIARSLTDRLIIPAFKDNKMIYYIARNLNETGKDSKKIKYLNAHVPKTSVLYGMDHLYTDVEKPLFITEGFFDSYHLNGVAVLENNMSNTQIELLSRSPRQKIIVPDKKKNQKDNDNGKKLATQALELGWSIALPDYGICSDITESVIKYGKTFVLNSVSKNIVSGFEANVALNLW